MLTAAFRAMDTDVDLAVAEPCDRAATVAAFESVEALFLRYDRALTRFSEDSELSSLNRAAGSPFTVSELLFEVVRAALQAAESSGGIFDPTVLDALRAAGYDKTFAVVSLTFGTPRTGEARPTDSAYRHVHLDAGTNTIRLPEGVHLDLGGIAKGMAVDAGADLLRPFVNFFVNAGGDLYAGGESECGAWPVGVQDPFNPERDIAVLDVRDAGIATSSIMRRRWQVMDAASGVEHHHLIDPRTGTSAETDLAAVTVVACDTATADILAKVALILGRKHGRAYLTGQGAAGVLIGLDGSVEASTGLAVECRR